MISSYPIYKNFHIATTSAGVQIVTGSGVLHTINVNTPIAGQVINVIDGTNSTASKICAITVVATIAPIPSLLYDVKYAIGLFLVTTTGAADISISYL